MGIEPTLLPAGESLKPYSHLVVPGVSTFGSLMQELNTGNFVEGLEEAKQSGKAILGLCAGMQVMGRSSEESPNVGGLGWFDFHVTKISSVKNKNLRDFHTGWNDVQSKELGEQVGIEGCYYFNHSFHVSNLETPGTIGVTSNFEEFVSVVRSENVLGAQFHPEKSQVDGLRFLKRFSEMPLC